MLGVICSIKKRQLFVVLNAPITLNRSPKYVSAKIIIGSIITSDVKVKIYIAVVIPAFYELKTIETDHEDVDICMCMSVTSIGLCLW